jgi:hypothetical protein
LGSYSSSLRLGRPRANLNSVRREAKASVKPPNDLATRIFRKLKGARGVNPDELWQHALFFALPPQERCHASLKAARSALSLRHSTRKG